MRAVTHWKWQRLSAIALIPLTIWLLWALRHLPDASAATLAAWASAHALPLWLLVSLGLYHGNLGLEVIFEDYIKGSAQTACKKAALIALGLVWLAFSVSIFTL